jgi:hypothetical protein
MVPDADNHYRTDTTDADWHGGVYLVTVLCYDWPRMSQRGVF